MDDMESQKFESAFKDAFAEAKVDPSENVWNNIELDLARAEGGELKRRILFFKLLAAASVTFAMCVAGVGYYVVQNNDAVSSEILAEQQSRIESLMAEQTLREKSVDKGAADLTISPTDRSSSLTVAENVSDGEPKTGVVKYTNNSNVSYARYNQSGSTDKIVNSELIDDGSKSSNSRIRSVTNSSDPRESSAVYASHIQHLPKTISPAIMTASVQDESDPFNEMMLKLRQKELEMQAADTKEKKKLKSENLWTSVGFSAGGFNTVSSGTPAQSSSFAGVFANNNVADHQTKASGVAYTAGVSMGTRLSNRWVLQGGVNYMAQSSDYTADAVVTSDYQTFQAGSVNKMQSTDAEFLASAPYNVNNSLQYLGIPLQAGYLVVDRKFGIQINAGVSTDLFLQNTLTPESDALSRTTQGRGDDSPYRPLNFSGLLGTELSYRLGDRYRLALNPGIRYPFSSIYKSELGIKAMPLTFDVGLKFRYIFH